MKFTVKQFNDRFPTSDACLEELKTLRFADWTCPQCDSPKLYKVKGRAVYASPCGFQVHPLSGTIFHKSSTDLRTWFFAMYLVSTTKSGISAKQVERMTGVTYKTAWRMMKEIRTLMNEGGTLSGTVQIDETYIKPNPQRDFRLEPGRNMNGGKIVFGATDGTNVRVKNLPSTAVGNLNAAIDATVTKGSMVHSDGLLAYRGLPKRGYSHQWVDHRAHRWVAGDITTQGIENFWGQFKRGLYGVYRHCGDRYVEMYASEYAWRYSHRDSLVPMFDLLIARTV